MKFDKNTYPTRAIIISQFVDVVGRKKFVVYQTNFSWL